MTDQPNDVGSTATAPTDAWSMSSDQVQAKLAELSSAYRASLPAQDDPVKARYNVDRSHRFDKLMNGDVSERAKFDQALQQKIAADAASPETRDAVAITHLLTKAGLSPSIEKTGAEVQEYIAGKRSITPETRAALDAKIESWKRDSEFQRKLFSGDPEARRLLNIASAMRMAPVENSA
jgi:hypothetical protein